MTIYILAISELTKWSSEKLADVPFFPNRRKKILDDIAKINHVFFGKYVFVFQNGNLEFNNTWE